MPFEIGERVLFRSLQWAVADNASEHTVELFGRSAGNRGRTEIRAMRQVRGEVIDAIGALVLVAEMGSERRMLGGTSILDYDRQRRQCQR